MLYRYFMAWVAFLSALCLHAQSPEQTTVIAGKYTNVYEVAEHQWLIQFSPHISDTEKQEKLDALPFTRSYYHLPSPAVTLLTTKAGTSKPQLEQVLQQMPSVDFFSQGLIYADGTPEFPLNKIFVQLQNSAQLSDLKQWAQKHKAKVLGDGFRPDMVEIAVDKNSTHGPVALSNMLNEAGLFAWSEPDMLKMVDKLSTNDTYLSYQWALNNTGSAIQYNGTAGEDMNVFNAWNVSTGSSTVKVAILDEGVDLDHPDLIGNMLPGFDGHGLTAGDAINDDAHGTACAGIVAATGNNNLGTAGIAYDSKIVPIRIAYTDTNSGYWVITLTTITSSITWAWQTAGADILSNSWGGGSPSTAVQSAFNDARTLGRNGLGSMILASAGNDNSAVIYPAAYPEMISVAAMSMCGERKSPSSCDGETWWGSCFGTGLDVAAPGVKIYTSDIAGADGYSSGDYAATFNGTSSACPNAAGVAALILSVNSALTESQARQVLESTCDKAGPYTYSTVAGYPNGTRCDDLGYGRVNAFAAVQAAQNLISNCPFSGQVGVFNVSGNSATVYIANSSASNPNYLIEYGVSGFAVGTGTVINTSTDTTVLSGLTSLTSYDVYYRLDCGTDTSAYLPGPSFTTPCAAEVAPYTQDFENLAITNTWFPDFGECWTSTDANGVNPRWEVEDALGANENSSATGPWYDYTSYGSVGGRYIYLEASSPANPGDTANFISPLIDINALANPLLRFYYHMYGSTMGSMHVDVHDGVQWHRDVWVQTGEQQSSGDAPWRMAEIPMSGYGNLIQLRFRGIRGSSFYSDMAVDDISVFDGPPTATCNVQLQCSYSVYMSDSYGDGWNGNVLGFVQNGQTVAYFGQSFTSGFQSATVRYALCGGADVDIVVESLGSWTQEIGFVVVDFFSGDTIYSRSPGNSFSGSTVFHSFTPSCGATPCLSPVVSAVNQTTADITINWTGQNGNTGYNNFNLALLPAGDPLDMNVVGFTSGNQITYSFSVLQSNTTYAFYLRDSCGVGQVSPWDTTYFTTPCADSYGATAVPMGNYQVNLSWTDQGASTYWIYFREVGDTSWSRVVSSTTSKILRNREPATYEWYITEVGDANPSCVSTFTTVCEDFNFNSNVFQIIDGTGGKVFVNQISGGRRLWDIGIRDSADAQQDTNWVANRFANRFRNLTAGTYYIFVRDRYGCYSSQVDTVVIDPVDPNVTPVLNAIVNLGGGSLRPQWSIGNSSAVNAYQIRVRDVTNGGANATLFNTYAVGGGTTNQFVISGLPNGRFRIDVRARPVGGTFSDGVYSNYMERIVSSSKSEEESAGGALTDVVSAYPVPTSGYLYVVAPEGSHLELMEISGRRIDVKRAEAGETQFNMHDLAQGAYLIRITNEDQVVIKKIMKE